MVGLQIPVASPTIMRYVTIAFSLICIVGVLKYFEPSRLGLPIILDCFTGGTYILELFFYLPEPPLPNTY